MTTSIIRGPAPAPSGHRKIDWVRGFMPALSQKLWDVRAELPAAKH